MSAAWQGDSGPAGCKEESHGRELTPSPAQTPAPAAAAAAGSRPFPPSILFYISEFLYQIQSAMYSKLFFKVIITSCNLYFFLQPAQCEPTQTLGEKECRSGITESKPCQNYPLGAAEGAKETHK